jgi:hypothetical protein
MHKSVSMLQLSLRRLPFTLCSSITVTSVGCCPSHDLTRALHSMSQICSPPSPQRQREWSRRRGRQLPGSTIPCPRRHQHQTSKCIYRTCCLSANRSISLKFFIPYSAESSTALTMASTSVPTSTGRSTMGRPIAEPM